jgi:secreted Zn-dependent insulinase-like peptidase
MKLVVHGRDLDKLQADVVKHFSDVRVRPNTELPEFSKVGMPFDKESLQHMFHVAPVKDKQVLSLSWAFESLQPQYRTKPDQYVVRLPLRAFFTIHYDPPLTTVRASYDDPHNPSRRCLWGMRARALS